MLEPTCAPLMWEQNWSWCVMLGLFLCLVIIKTKKHFFPCECVLWNVICCVRSESERLNPVWTQFEPRVTLTHSGMVQTTETRRLFIFLLNVPLWTPRHLSQDVICLFWVYWDDMNEFPLQKRLFTYFIEQLILGLKIIPSFSPWCDEAWTLRKCSYQWGGGGGGAADCGAAWCHLVSSQPFYVWFTVWSGQVLTVLDTWGKICALSLNNVHWTVDGSWIKSTLQLIEQIHVVSGWVSQSFKFHIISDCLQPFESFW